MTNPLLAQAKTTTADHTKQPETFVRGVPPEGPTPARLIGYVEIGKRPQYYNGTAKQPALEALLVFELNGKKHLREIESDGTKKVLTNRVVIRLPVKNADRAAFGKLFRAMRDGREEVTSMAHMLNDGFIVHVKHNVVGEGDKKRTYANLRDDSGWRVGPPIHADPLDPDNVVHIPVPEATQSLMLLLWDNPTKEQWDSLFIDGTHTRKIDGEDVEVTNNWIQQEIVQKALDFENSPLADLLAGIGGLTFEPDTHSGDPEAGPVTPVPEAQKEQDAPSEAQPQAVAADKPAKASTAPAQATAEPTADDILASLGL